ncbi:MAG: hypothetical protein N3G80_01785 [Candidatus Micrarchaeota archaeon]|nr:hypothetical protein [Candidatus Micrarchaeota archaeon]
MGMTFRKALYFIGVLLSLIGLFAAILVGINSPEPLDIFEAISHGITSMVFAFFSGVLFGAGAAFFIMGLVLGIRSSFWQLIAALAFALLSALLGLSAVANPLHSSFLTLGLFFAGISSSGVFLMSIIILEAFQLLNLKEG